MLVAAVSVIMAVDALIAAAEDVAASAALALALAGAVTVHVAEAVTLNVAVAEVVHQDFSSTCELWDYQMTSQESQIRDGLTLVFCR
jgi:hypothetical protein